MEREKGMQNHSLFPPSSRHLSFDCIESVTEQTFFSVLSFRDFPVELLKPCPNKTGETLGYFHMHFQVSDTGLMREIIILIPVGHLK